MHSRNFLYFRKFATLEQSRTIVEYSVYVSHGEFARPEYVRRYKDGWALKALFLLNGILFAPYGL